MFFVKFICHLCETTNFSITRYFVVGNYVPSNVLRLLIGVVLEVVVFDFIRVDADVEVLFSVSESEYSPMGHIIVDCRFLDN